MTKYKITNERGAPRLHMGEREVPAVLYGLSDIPGSNANTAQAQRNIANFAAAGIDLVCADTGLHIGWRRVTEYDTEVMREEISSVLEANPKAKVLLRLHVNPPYWWHRDHPEECVLYRTPEGDVPGIDDGEFDRLIRNDHNRHLRVSLASEVWRREASEKLALFLHSLEGTPEGEALFAVQIACGVNGEWHQWGTDVSAPMQRRFRQYLRETYGTDEALRRAWGDPDVTIETAAFRPDHFRPGDDGSLRDPRISQDTIDSQRCFQMVGPEAIVHFCRVVREIMPNVLTGAFYAYYLNVNGTSTGAHLRTDILRESGVVDFLCGPFCYMENRKPYNVPMQRALLESHRLTGVLWLTEMDQFPAGTEKYHGGDPERLDETVSVLRRNVLQPLCGGEGFWYYDHRIVPHQMPKDTLNSAAASIYRKKGWWDKPELMEEITKIQRLAEKITARDYKSAADVLVVYDTDSFYYRARVNDEEYLLHEALMRAGRVFDCIYLDDLPLADMARYKCVIFANCVKLTPAQREEIRRLTAGRMRIFLNACGICDGERIDAAAASAAVGMQLLRTEAASLHTDAAAYAYKAVYPPALAVCDAHAEVIARWDSGEAAGAICGEDVFFPLPYLPRETAADLLTRAGAHRWCDSGEPVIAGAGIVGLQCQRCGTRTLTLPDGREIPVESDGFAMPVYGIESGERMM